MRPRPSTRGLTLSEVLIACSLLVLLSAIFASIFSQARGSSEGGAEKIALRAVHREAQTRLSRLLRSAIAPTEIDPAVVEPVYLESSSTLRFHAPSDLIDGTQIFDSRTPEYPEFTLRRDSHNGGLALQRSDGTGPRQFLGFGFSSVSFGREDKRIVSIELTSEKTVRGVSGASKTIKEFSTNAVQLPGYR